jgi:hypothetical protein
MDRPSSDFGARSVGTDGGSATASNAGEVPRIDVANLAKIVGVVHEVDEVAE